MAGSVIPFGIASYPSDNGTVFNKRMNASHYAVSNLVTGASGQPLYPHKWKCRVFDLVCTTTPQRARIICGVTAAAWLSTGVAVSLIEASGTVAMTSVGSIGEKRPGLAKPF
jgi:hypothetical protein